MTQRLTELENTPFTKEQLEYLQQHITKAPLGGYGHRSKNVTAACINHETEDEPTDTNAVADDAEPSREQCGESCDRPEVKPTKEIDTTNLFDLHKWFKHTSVVSLDKFPKRWEKFQERATQAGITGYKKMHAIEGDKVPPSGWFRGGNGAWGCLMSHLRIVQDALMDDEPGHILVFEDDAVFSDDWLDRMHKIMEEVGDDWDMIYTGGQHLHMPRVKPYRMPYNKEVINARNINRTHAFAINKRFLRKYQQHIMYAPDYIDAKSNFHIDHQLGILHQHQSYKILAVQPWINGQGAGLSWTCGRKTGENWWKINEQQILKQN